MLGLCESLFPDKHQLHTFVFGTPLNLFYMTQKLLYTAPVAEALVVQAEGTILDLSGGKKGTPGSAGRVFDSGDIHDYDGL